MADGIDVKAEGRKTIDRQQDAMRQAAGKDYVDAGARHFRPPMPTRYSMRQADWTGNFKRSPQYIAPIADTPRSYIPEGRYQPFEKRLSKRSNGKKR
jgi:hypothetical protein